MFLFFCFLDDADLTGKVKQLREECTRDVTSIQACAECFQSWIDDRYNFFTNVCSKPHLLVFAKVASYLPWPAKVMSTCGDKVNVEFFGDHSQADVSFKQCTLYRKNTTKPVKKDAKKSAPYKLYNDALEVFFFECSHKSFNIADRELFLFRSSNSTL